MNKIKEKNIQAHITTSLNKYINKVNIPEPELIPISWLTRIFGCWHKKMGIPFTRENRTYRTGMLCGTCQNFDVKSWKTKVFLL